MANFIINEEEGTITLTVPMNIKPSSTGKTILLASVSEKAGVQYQGKPITVSVNIHVPADIQQVKKSKDKWF